MIEIDLIDKVSDFIPTEFGLFLWADGKVYLDGNLIYDKNPNAVQFQLGIIFIVESNWKDSVYIDTLSGYNNILKDVGGMICFLDRQSILYNKWNEDYTVSYEQRIDLKSNKILWEHESYLGRVYVEGDLLFGTSNAQLFRSNPKTGNIIWQLNLLESYGACILNEKEHSIDVQTYIGICKGCLYFKVSNKLLMRIKS